MKSADWDERYAAADLVWSSGPNQWVESFAGELPPGTALDIAAGEGRNAIWLGEHGWTVTASDFSRVAVERTRQIAAERLGAASERVRTVVGDATEPHPEYDRAFDLVVVAYLQLPAQERSTALRGAARAVAPGGHLIVTAHDSRNLAEGYGGPSDPAVLYGPDDVVADIEGEGLRISRAETVTRVVDRDGEAHKALDALVTAHRDR